MPPQEVSAAAAIIAASGCDLLTSGGCEALALDMADNVGDLKRPFAPAEAEAVAPAAAPNSEAMNPLLSMAQSYAKISGQIKFFEKLRKLVAKLKFFV